MDFQKYCFCNPFSIKETKNLYLKQCYKIFQPYSCKMLNICSFPIHLCLSTTEFRWDLSNGEVSNNPELCSLYRHMYIYKTFLLVQTRLYLDICMKSMNGNKLKIAFK